MNIHTQQTDCEGEIAAGAWGLGPGAQTPYDFFIGRAAVHLDGKMAASAKLPYCCQNRTGVAMPKGQGGEGSHIWLAKKKTDIF